MQIQSIGSFVMLCREKNISKCSEKLHISQQGLSRQMKALENEVGAKLLLRTNKGVELTREGEILLPKFQKLWDSYTAGMKELREYQKNHQEVLSVAVCPGIKSALGLDFFMKFQQENPAICLRLNFQSDMDCEEALHGGRVDAAFLDWPIHEAEYDAYLVVKSPLVAVMKRDHPLAGHASISMRELAGTHIYIPDESHRMHQRFLEHWPDFYHSVIIDFTHNDYEAFYHELPKKAGGVALTFRFLCNNLDAELVAVPVEEESYVELFYCVKKDCAPNAALDKFSDFIYRHIDVVE